jgi:hypothetical protein
MRKLLLMLLSVVLLINLACTQAKEPDPGPAFGFSIVYLSSIWEKITPNDVDPSFTYGGLAPGCSSCPPTIDKSTGKKTVYNPDYFFFVRRGDPDRILVFFMGGGACWDITNCAYHHVYVADIFESPLYLGAASKGVAAGIGLGGILDTLNSANPFRDWTMVYVPYCTGDLGVGANDNVYTDHYQPGSGTYPGNAVTIHHRGLVNVKLVLKWMENNLNLAPAKLFITGTSAGSYTAVMNFPYIRDLFNDPSTEAYVLGDAGVGVSGVNAVPEPFLQTAEGPWGVVLPSSVPGNLATYHYNYKELFQEIAGQYPLDRFAQYTTKWDRIQSWFYDIQTDDHINFPDTWGSERNAKPSDAVMNNWNGSMMPPGPPGIIDIGGPNYWYYIAAGGDHTILLKSKFFTEKSGGVSFAGWVDDFVNDRAMANQVCSGCNLP